MKSAAPLLLLLALAVGTTSCKKNPIERLVNPYGDSSVPGISGTYTIFDDELKTGGAVGFIPFGENQSIDFSDKTSPRRSANHVRYQWNGLDTSSTTAGATQHDFAGFSLFFAPTIGAVPTSPGVNLSLGGYTMIKLWVRGELSEGNRLRIEGPDDGDSFTPTARVELSADQLGQGWQEITLPIPVTDFQSVKVFMTISLQYSQPPRTTAAGDGGTVYLDDIRYE